jgi:hypothetical protein
MTKTRLSSETTAAAALTILSLVGGVAVACTAGVGIRTVSSAAAHSQGLTPASTPGPAPAPSSTPPVDPALASPRLRFPADAVIDVRRAYHAAGDGTTDDTAALQKAITENPGRTIYLPSGTYLVSRALEARDRSGNWRAGLRLIGEHRDTTIIRLADHATGFANHWSPRPVLRTGASDVATDRSGQDSGYGNQLDNFTIDTGANPGANGIDYTGSNVAAVRRLTITGHGQAGLSMTRSLTGPALISQLAVQGFDYGIRVAPGRYGLTMEHLNLSGQRIAGLENAGNILAMRDLTSTNTVPAIRSTGRTGFVSLIDADLTGGDSDFSAIQSVGELLARRISTAGYRSAITQSGRIIAGASAAQYLSKAAFVPFPGTATTATDLPVRETPDYLPSAPGDWASVTELGAKPDDNGDDTTAFQQALDSGKPVIYLRTGRYVISRTLHVRGAVREIAGFGSTLTPGGAAFGNAAAPAALIQVEDGTGADVTISDLTVTRPRGEASPTDGLIGFAHRTTRPLILTDIGCCGRYQASYQAAAGAGPLYLEDVSASGWRFDRAQLVWARQFNNVDSDLAGPAANTRVARLVNAGATVWMLGFESEQDGPLVRTEHGGRTEVLGGAVYESGSVHGTAFECLDGSSISLSFATTGPSNGGYRVLVRQQRGTLSLDLARGQAAWRADGRAVPLYTG